MRRGTTPRSGSTRCDIYARSRYRAPALVPQSIDPSGQVDPHPIVDVYAHPLRGRVFTALMERPDVTVRRVAERLGESPSRVRHQIDALVDLGLAVMTGEEVAGGVVRRRYGPSPAGAPQNYQGEDGTTAMAKAVVRVLMESIAAAAAANTLSRRPDDYEVRMYGEVDEACLRELADLHRRAYHEIFGAVQRGRRRVWESGERGTEIVSALFFFEAPLWGPRSPRASGRARNRPASTVDASADPSWPSGDELSIQLDPQELATAYEHPVRYRVLTAVAERPDVTIREIAERLEEPPRRVRHHVEALRKIGLVAVTSSESLAGVVQHRFGAGPLVVDDAANLTREQRVRFANATVRLLAADLGVAAAAGRIGKGPDEFEIRMYGEVDDACLEELGHLHHRADRSIRKAIYEGRARLRESREPGTEVVSALFFFEAPLWGSLPPDEVPRPPCRDGRR